MSSCPHPHKDIVPVHERGQSVSFCREGCSKTFFFCSHCRERGDTEANHPLARFCRRCSNSIDFKHEEENYEASFHFSRTIEQTRNYNLSGYGVKDVRSMTSYRGYLIVVADNCMLLFDSNFLSEPLYKLNLSGGFYFSGVAAATDSERNILFIATSGELFKLNLLNFKSNLKLCYKAKGGSLIIHSALEMAGSVYMLKYDRSNDTSTLIRLPDHTVTDFKGLSSPLLALDDRRILLASNKEIFIYDCKQESLSARTAPVILKQNGLAYNREMGILYLTGESRLWKLDVNNQEPNISPLTATLFGDPCFAAGRHSLVVAHTNGVSLLDPFGSLLWDSSHEFITAQSDGLVPQIYGDFFTFTSIGKMGGSILRIHRLNRPGDLKEFIYEHRLLCSPLPYLGRVIAAVGNEHSVELKVADLGFLQAASASSK